VGNVEHRHPELLADANEVGKDPSAKRQIERSERLVEEQDLRTRAESAREGHALPLPSGERRAWAVEDSSELQDLHDSSEQRGSRAWSEEHVRARRVLGQEQEILRYVADSALRQGDVDSALAVVERSPGDDDPPARRSPPAGDDFQQAGLAGARRTEDAERTSRAPDVDLQGVVRQGKRARDLEDRGQPSALRFAERP
jgi:hypothetical protein